MQGNPAGVAKAGQVEHLAGHVDVHLPATEGDGGHGLYGLYARVRAPLPPDSSHILTDNVGREPVQVVSNGGLDANWLNAHGIPTVTLGCGQMNVHMTSEMLDLAGFRDACKIALQLATGS